MTVLVVDHNIGVVPVYCQTLPEPALVVSFIFEDSWAYYTENLGLTVS
jgi:hypothetical protein